MAPENRNDELFQLVKHAKMPDQEKAHLLTCLETFAQVPEITSDEQYELYSKLERELELTAKLPDRNAPTFGEAFLTFIRSPAGVMAHAYSARMMEWENKQPEDAESEGGF